jgi:5'(3')-deoxyribonucleotidase
MKIAIDCDGVLYDFIGAFLYMSGHYLGVDTPHRVDWTTWNHQTEFLTPEQESWMWTEAVQLGLYRYGHVIKGGIVGVRELKAAGHSLELVTHRPVSAVQDTLDWLSYVRLPFDEVRILSNGESKTTIDADVLIDDKPDNVLEWVKSGRHAIKFEQPWNKYVALAGLDPERGKMVVAKDWKEVTKWVHKLSA